MSAGRPYDFPYVPVPTAAGDDDGAGLDLVVATSEAVDPDVIVRALAPTCGESSVRDAFAHAPVFWSLVRTARGHARADVESALRGAGVPVRYVASAKRESLSVPPPLAFDGAPGLRATAWAPAPPRDVGPDTPSNGRWFLSDGPGGLAVQRDVCGTGQGTRLAVIDDDVADLDRVALDATVLVGVERPSCASGHGAVLIGWAVGARTHEGTAFLGVAPDASVRAYLVPRPGEDVVSLPTAIARAAVDGADVIVCATYLEGSTSPMLDDALELATRLGRDGLGCVVVLPTGRETSSPRGSIHASLTLSLGDPASDPRVICVGPGGRRGGWFLWREQRGRLRPFANRGPAVRCIAPGDDLAYPFLDTERLFHAESSGAAALVAGVALLVLSHNPWLLAGEVASLLVRSATRVEAWDSDVTAALVDRADSLPAGRDRDGHDAKHGYGRIHALHACLAAADPVGLELLAMGEETAAREWLDARRSDPAVAGAYSQALGCWAVRALLADPTLEHALRVVLRHVRLVAADPRRAEAHGAGGLGRQLALFLRSLERAHPPPGDAQRRELRIAAEGARQATSARAASSADACLLALARAIFPPPSSASRAGQEVAGVDKVVP